MFLGKRSAHKESQEAKPTEPSNLMVEQSMKNHVERLGLDYENIQERIARLSAKTSSRVKISVQASTEYRVCTTDPQGDSSDNWATLRATFLQTFRIAGDRIVRGEEIVQVNVTDSADMVNTEEYPAQANQSTDSLTPFPLRLGRRRRASTDM